MNLLRVSIGLFFLALSSQAQQTKTLLDFETPDDLRFFEFKQKSASLSTEHATHGAHSVKIAANEYLNSFRLPKDWSGFDALELDIFVEGDSPVSGSLLIADEAWQKSGGSYWNRHNGSFNLKPGANTLSIPVNGLYRGEAGSRNNDLKSNINPKQIIRVDIGFRSKDKTPRSLYLDHLRLTKESRPAGILAFDLGPSSQTVAPGFTAISPATVYGKNGNAAGMNFAGTDGQARDDTFPTRLYRDCIIMDGFVFIADVPEKNGKYHGWVMYDDLGYWGGEVATYRKRQILANNATAFSEDRGESGPTDFLYHFENTEPHPGDKLWDLYMTPLFKPRTFSCQAQDGKIKLKFSADSGMSCKVAAIVLYPDAIKDEAEKWLGEVETRNRAEFETRAVDLTPKPVQFAPPLERRMPDDGGGYFVNFPRLEDDITFTDPPISKAQNSPLSQSMTRRPAARNQRISFSLAIRPFKDFPAEVKLTATDLKCNTGATISAAQIDLRYVHQAAHRSFNDIAYKIGPDTLRPLAGAKLKLLKDQTRQFWITVHVPADAAAGIYRSEITLSAGDLKYTTPLEVQVLSFTLDEPDFSMGFFGTNVPHQVLQARGDDAWRDLFRTLKEFGMNSFSGGPNVHFKGLDAAGKPILDFAAVDHFMKLARAAGFDKELNGYGGPGLVTNLHESHSVGETGHGWEKKTGKPFGEILKIVWSAVRDHAKENNWLPIAYEFIDEPRVLDQARKNVELMALYRDNAPWVNIGGSYSVDWKKTDPFDLAVQDLFKTVKWSALNLHTQVDLDKAKEFGKTIDIYNQAKTRFSFGAYQWAEMHKGIKARMEWHLLALHGYQFFDLDGREPDTAVINWTSSGIVPNIVLARCREGADDFRYAVTLWNLAQKQKETQAGKEAIAWLNDISEKIPLDHRTRPQGFMDDDAFRAACIEKITQLKPPK
jgi:hypothetical protein